MPCPNCATENRAGARFCATCGSRLPEAPPAVTDEPESNGPVSAGPTPLPEQDQLLADGAATGNVEPEELMPTGYEGEEAGAGGIENAAFAAESDDAGGLSPLPAGTLLADRYEIVELIASDDHGNLYRAVDLARCGMCGFDGNAVDDEYCADCGAALATPPACQIREQPQMEEPEAMARFSADGRTYAVLAPPAGGDGALKPALPGRIRLNWAARTDPGQVRELNEDRIGIHTYAAEAGPSLGLFVVADGVGGHQAGEVASRVATQVIWDRIREAVWMPELQGEPVLPETMEARVEEAVQAANQTVYQQRTEQSSNMGTTATVALVRDDVAFIANVGDSRAYLWNASGLQRLTVDHSLVQSLVDAGEVEPEEVYTHPQRNIIYRSIGDRPQAEIDTFVYRLALGDRLLLCSDGLWEMARDEGIEEILLREQDPELACSALVELANLAGGTDNISVVIVKLDS